MPQGGGGGRAEAFGPIGPNFGAATPGRRRGPPLFRSAQGGGGAARTDVVRVDRILSRRPRGGGSRPPLFRKTPGRRRGPVVSLRSVCSGIKGVGTREEEKCRRFCYRPLGRRNGASQEFLLAVCGFYRHAGDHRAAEAKVGQFPRRQGAQFTNCPIVDATTFHRHTEVFDKAGKTVGKASVRRAGAVYVCHRRLAFVSGSVSAFCCAVETKMGQMLQLHNTFEVQCCHAATAWRKFIKLL